MSNDIEVRKLFPGSDRFGDDGIPDQLLSPKGILDVM